MLCRWCTSVDDGGAAELLQSYCAGSLSAEEEQAVNEDLCYCMECVVEYHRVREEFPSLHKSLWDLETSRLLGRFSQAAEEELEDDDLFVVEDDKEIKVSKTTAAEYANLLRFPLLEILKYPYLMGHPKLSEMCVEALCKMEKSNSFQVFEKYPGIYLLLVHPSETVRRWAIGVARSLGNVDRDDFYDLQDIFSWLVSRNFPDMDTSYDPSTKMRGLPSHLYDSSNEKNYWLGVCMLLTQLDAQAMDSLFLGPDKQANILQCILNTMERSMEDEETDRNTDPFWPALQCFMVILDRLGSKIWGQIEPAPAFQTITGSPSYMAEIENIRHETMISQVKVEPAYGGDDMVSCSQMVYECNSKDKKSKAVGGSRGVDGSVVYEEMNSLVNLLQSDMGQAMRVHNSTFLWFIPFVKSVMDLNQLIYINEVIHYLCGEINRDLLNRRVCTCDKVTEFFTLILVYIIDLHLRSGRMNMLFYCAPKWAEVVVKCATLPREAFIHRSDGPPSYSVSSTSSSRLSAPCKATASSAVPQACMSLLRSLLKEGSRLTSNKMCAHFLNLLNKQLREGPQRQWSLMGSEIKDLQICLRQLAKMMDRPATNTPSPEPLDMVPAPQASALQFNSDTSEPSGLGQAHRPIKEEVLCNNGENSSSVCKHSSVQTDHLSLKKEPVTPEEDFIEDGSRPNLELTSLRLDPGKMQVIRSKVSQFMPKSKTMDLERGVPSEGGLSRFVRDSPKHILAGNEEEAESPRPSTSDSHMMRTPQAESFEGEEGDDMPLSVLKSKLEIQNRPKLSEDMSDSPKYGCNQSTFADVIILSDDDDDADGEKGKGPLAKLKMKTEPSDTSDLNHSSWLDYDVDISESQVFEFETQEDVVSVWTDTGLENNVTSEKTREDSAVRPPVNPSHSEPSFSSDYATQPISDEDIERACQQVEEELGKKMAPQGLKRAVVVKKRSIFVEPKPLPVKCPSKKVLSGEKKIKAPVRKAPQITTPPPEKRKSKAHSNSAEMEANPSTSSISPPTPAIVPYKKIRTPTEPLSTAEKLGLKKRERKAFDLSQRSLDCVDQLRRYGQGVHVEQKKKRTRETKKSKMILPQKIVVKGSNKRLMASQDLQFFRQSRAKQQVSDAGPPKQAADNRESGPKRRNANMPNDDTFQRSSVTDEEEEEQEDDDYFLPSSQPDPDLCKENQSLNRRLQESSDGNKPTSSTVVSKEPASSTVVSKEPASSNIVSNASPIRDQQISPYFQNNVVDVSTGTSDKVVRGNQEEDDEDWMYLTQMEPTDMELCSQMEEEGADFFNTQRDPVDMDIDTASQMPSEREPCDSTSPSPADEDKGFKKPAPKILRTTSAQEDDRLFLKPGMSPISLKNAKPSTTKIYAPTSSRSASLVLEMEKTANVPAAASAGRGRPVRPVRKPSPSQPQPLPQPEFHPMLPPKQPPPKLQPKQLPPRPLPLPPTHASRPFHRGTNCSTPQPPIYKTYPRPDAPVAREMPTMDAGINLDPSTPIQHILKWTYDMFCSYKQFGPPSDLCAFPLGPVGIRFRSFNEYYRTIYPLLLTNTFEKLVNEWLKNTLSRRLISKNLRGDGNDYSNGVWNARFSANITADEESRQLYPKEDDLVILWLPQNTGAYSSDEHEYLEPKAHLGCVYRSNVINGGVNQCPTLNLVIKTHGNVTSVNKQPVRCEVVGSLISTLREYRALTNLKSSPMLRQLLFPQVSCFQPGQDTIPNLNLPGYNADQVNAVRHGISSIKNQQRTPKICLIHGPPGTGKSKTIVGLLERFFSEGHQSMAPLPGNRHSKARHTQVLLCAPSNAAIDNLMKKIILVFKEKCKNFMSPQGNCGDINVVRLGMDRAISKSLKLFSLDSQTKNRTQKAQMSLEPDVQLRRVQLDESIDRISKRFILMNKDSKEYRDLLEQSTRLIRERQTLSYQLKQTRGQKQDTQAKVLQDAHIICCTLSTSGSVVLESAFRRLGHEPFSCVIVDEAGQATETETLIPMLYRSNALILVGDPEQLPPTVISQKAKELNFGQSLMARLCKSLHHTCKDSNLASPVVFLSLQYRMHPDICEFPSKYIYNKALKTDVGTAEKRCVTSWPFQSYRLFDVRDGCEVKERESFSNEKEVKLVMFLLKLIAERRQVKVGVITPYNAQKDRILREVNKESNKHLMVEVDTVDGFQGREMDCIIVSCVRASNEGGIGFLGNRQRLNVTITRAKFSLFILGHLRTLMTDKEWGALIDDAGKRDTIIKTEESTFKNDGKKIFKPEPALSRSLSYPPRDPVLRASADAPARVGTERPTAPALARHRHTTASSSIQGRGSSPLQHPSSASPPQVADRPRDPRLAPQPVQHPPAPQLYQYRAEVIRDPRVESVSDPRVEGIKNPRLGDGREKLHPTGYSHNQRLDRDRDRDRERRSSPGSMPPPSVSTLRDPRQANYNRHSPPHNPHTHTLGRHTQPPQKRASDTRLIPPTHSKRGKR